MNWSVGEDNVCPTGMNAADSEEVTIHPFCGDVIVNLVIRVHPTNRYRTFYHQKCVWCTIGDVRITRWSRSREWGFVANDNGIITCPRPIIQFREKPCRNSIPLRGRTLVHGNHNVMKLPVVFAVPRFIKPNLIVKLFILFYIEMR